MTYEKIEDLGKEYREFIGGRVERKDTKMPWLCDDGTWSERDVTLQFTVWRDNDIQFSELDMIYDTETGEILARGL